MRTIRTIVSATFVLGLSTMAIAQSADMQPDSARSEYKGGCYPDIDPKTGFPFPVCPRSIRDTNLVTDRNESAIIDITTDAYKRVAQEKFREGELTQKDYDKALERVKEGREHARGPE